MNLIAAQIDKSDYDIYHDFLNIKIDGVFLDELIEAFYPNTEDQYKGTIPTLLFAMEVAAESKVVWDRILPELNCKTYCPVLMCPDDCDFSCTLLIAEIECHENEIIWYRLGVDITRGFPPEAVGSEVRWLDKIPSFVFNKKDYLAVLETFKQQFQIDKKAWEVKHQAFIDKAKP